MSRFVPCKIYRLMEIAGANGASFTYDWDSYDQKLIKVVVTRNGDTFESAILSNYRNKIQAAQSLS